MTNQQDSFPDMMHEDLGFEVVMRGYSRRQVHDHMVRTRNQIRDLEERLARAIDQAEQGRIELAEARRRLAEAPQDYDELGQRLSAILKLGEEEALAKRETADAEAAKVREDAAAEAERILSAAQSEAERRVHEATTAAERLLAQAGSDAEETLGTARAESEETLRNARAEADRALTTAQHEAERLVTEAGAQAKSARESAAAEAEATLNSARAEATETLTSAQRRAASLDDHTGRRVAFLTDTHGEVMRRLNEMGSVLTDLLGRENAAGPLIDEAAVLPPRPVLGPNEDPRAVDTPDREELESVRVVLGDGAAGGGETGDVQDAAGDARQEDDAARDDGAPTTDDVRDGHETGEGHQTRGEHDGDPGRRDGQEQLQDHRLDDIVEVAGNTGFRGAGDANDHETPGDANDHETPGKGRVRGFFEVTDVHVASGANRAGDRQ